jgi:iron complex transport system permease protein
VGKADERPAARRIGATATGVALLAVLAAVGIALAVGPVGIGFADILASVASRLPFGLGREMNATEEAIVWEIRFPRVVLAALVGAALAVSGAAYQGVFRNPLADPYLLGVAAGAGLAATLMIAYGPSGRAQGSLLPVAAFVGGIAAVVAAYAVGRSVGRARDTATLVLAGVAVAAFLSAAQTFVQQRNAEELNEIFAWLLGGLTTSGWREVTIVAPYIVVSAGILLLHRRVVDVLAVGDEEARTLGLDVRRARLVIIVAATLATSAAVAVSGLVGFVGIVVPHLIRRLVAATYRVVIPLALAAGAAFLVAADTVARTVLAPAELPIGVVTAFVGAPFFAFVLRHAREAP